ncbi:trypsin-like serine peptidase [Streptomyces sp. NPDC051563]|uniref:trypsin-like serine peptidase n=1 Tax=Streptomyces sp. NPDC051563 TaxID=3365659 RepID=UPI003793D0E7
MRSGRFTLTVVCALMALLGPAAPAPAAGLAPVPAAGPAPPPPASGARSAEAYWTAERMAAAVPVDAARSRAAAGARAPSGIPAGVHFDGMPMVGTFFYRQTAIGTADTSCTGSVVRSAGKSMVLTAGHCALGMRQPGNRAVFVPRYRHGKTAAAQPFGVFPVRAGGVYTDPRYRSPGSASVSDLDLAFVLVEPNAKGRVESVTGALTFTPVDTYEHRVTVVGYPSASRVNKGHQAVRCEVPTTRLRGFRQLRMVCKGFYGGVSGGPWIKDYDAARRTGKVIATTGGYRGGGNDSWVTYAPVYGKDALALYADAAAGRDPAALSRPPYRGSAEGFPLPGSGELWTHARAMASGDFTGSGRSSLLVVWTDGEVSLHPGNGRGGFLAERRLMAPNAAWKDVAAVTAGDFTGSDLFDLLVRRKDGRMTLYADVGSHGLGRVTEMAPAGSVWKHAAQITAGRFDASHYVTDLVVRWSDGELTLHTAVGAGTFGREHRLSAPGPAWKGAALLAAGQFSGNGKWDLMVRWSNGALCTRTGLTTRGPGSERRLRGPDRTWTHSVLMTAGRYSADGLADDLLVRWSDGETSLYEDTRAAGLGTERMLVPPQG